MLTMMNTNATPKTLLEAVKFFADYENCRKFMMDARWPNGVVRCPTCGSDHVTYMANTRRWKCYGKHPRATVHPEGRNGFRGFADSP